MSAVLLSRKNVQDLLSPADCLEAVEKAFRASRSGAAHAPLPLHISSQRGGFHAKGALFQQADKSYAAIKINANFPGNPKRNGCPTIQGVIALFDANNGAILALLDSIEITLLRTAAASALAALHLSRKDARTMLICGCGDQAAAQVAALTRVRSIAQVFVYDVDTARATAFAQREQTQLSVPVESVRDLTSASRRSDIIVTCTTARTPILGVADVLPGTFIAAVGADNPEKNEIAPALLAQALVVVDVLQQCTVMGDLHHAIEAGVMSPTDVHAELADIVTETRPARTDDTRIIVFDSTGTALQDVACAVLAYERALSGKFSQFQFN